MLEKPSDERFSFAFCSTGDSYLAYVVDWESDSEFAQYLLSNYWCAHARVELIVFDNIW